jgi:hypothetical protein
MSKTDEWVNKLVKSHSGTLFRLKKEWNIDTWHNMDEPWKHYSKWKGDAKNKNIYFKTSIFSKYPRFRIYKKDAEGWLLRAKERRSSCFLGAGFPFRWWHVLELVWSGGWTIHWIY